MTYMVTVITKIMYLGPNKINYVLHMSQFDIAKKKMLLFSHVMSFLNNLRNYKIYQVYRRMTQILGQISNCEGQTKNVYMIIWLNSIIIHTNNKKCSYISVINENCSKCVFQYKFNISNSLLVNSVFFNAT